MGLLNVKMSNTLTFAVIPVPMNKILHMSKSMIKVFKIVGFTYFFPYCLIMNSYLENNLTKAENLPLETTTIKAMTWTI